MSTDAREPTNAAAQAHRLIAGLRAANGALRSSEYSPDEGASAPLSDDDIVAEFARDTGVIINTNGQAVGKVEGWVPPGTPGRDPVTGKAGGPIPPAPAGLLAPRPFTDERGDAMFGRKPQFAPGTRVTMEQIRGIDTDRGVVLVDGNEWPLSEDERKAIAAFCVDVMVRNLQAQIDGLKADNGLTAPPENPEESDGVPKVPEGPAGGGVPAAPGAVDGPAKVVPAVPKGPPQPHRRGGKRPTPAQARDGTGAVGEPREEAAPPVQ